VSSLVKGTRVRVKSAATYAVNLACKAGKVTGLLGTLITGKDPCCGCYVVEFDKKIGTDSIFYTDGKMGYCDEVTPEFITLSKAKAPIKSPLKSPSGFQVGDRVVVIKSYDAAKVGMSGMVAVAPEREQDSLGVKFDSLTPARGGHGLGGAISDGSGQWVPASYVTLSTETKLVEKPAEAKPLKPYAMALGPGNTVRIYFSLLKRTKLSGSDRFVSPTSYYGWLTVNEDGGVVRRVVVAPFSGREWLCLDVEDERIANIRPAA